LAEVEQQYAPDWQKLVANEPAAEKARAESRRLQTLLSASKRALELRLDGAKVTVEMTQRAENYRRPIEVAPARGAVISPATPKPAPPIRVRLHHVDGPNGVATPPIAPAPEKTIGVPPAPISPAVVADPVAAEPKTTADAVISNPAVVVDPVAVEPKTTVKKPPTALDWLNAAKKAAKKGK
jgi:hypothetical protein